jgi:hypothetical protein
MLIQAIGEATTVIANQAWCSVAMAGVRNPSTSRKDTHCVRTSHMPRRSIWCDGSLPEGKFYLAAIEAVENRKGKAARAGNGR